MPHPPQARAAFDATVHLVHSGAVMLAMVEFRLGDIALAVPGRVPPIVQLDRRGVRCAEVPRCVDAATRGDASPPVRAAEGGCGSGSELFRRGIRGVAVEARGVFAGVLP